MKDQSDDSTRPPKYGGPRDRKRTYSGRRPGAGQQTEREVRSGTGGKARSETGGEARSETGREVRLRTNRQGEFHRQERPSADRTGLEDDVASGRTEPRGRRYGHAPPRGDRANLVGPEPRPHGRPSAVESPVDDDLRKAFAVHDLETKAQKRVYRYVEQQGFASDDEIHERIDFPTEDIAIAIQQLVQRHYLEADDGTFRIARATAVEKTYRTGGIDVTIRPARQDDLVDLVELIRTVTDNRTYVVAESVAEQIASEKTVIRHTGTRSRLFFVATADDATVGDSRLVGWTHLTLPRIEYVDHTAELTVGVHGDFRRQGIGSQLVQVGLAWAAANGYRKVYQSLPGTNRAAIDFLRNHGWRVEAVRREHYHIDGEFVNEVMMAVALSGGRGEP